MAKRIAFELAIAWFSAAVVVSAVSVMTNSNLGAWLWILLLAGLAATTLGIAAALRDMTRLHWRTLNEIRSIGSDLRATAEVGQRIEANVSRQSTNIELVRLRVEEVGRDVAASRGRLDAITAELDAITAEQRSSYRQLESVIGLNAVVDLRAPLPPLRGTFALGPDTASYVVRTVLETRPRAIVEAGSGVSTVLLASVIGDGEARIRSIEHDPDFAAATLRSLESNGFDHRVDLVIADLVEWSIGGEQLKWYAPDALSGLSKVEFLLIDGPPESTGPMARYPAIPALAELLERGALVFVDDARRRGEAESVQRWLDRFPVRVVDKPALERGGILLEWVG